jgi:NADPH-dependent curcumin reductase CurA
MTNKQVLLRRRPIGRPSTDDFEIVDRSVPALAEGDVLRRTIYLSLDPYMRGRMSDGPSYSAPVGLGQTMVGHTVSEVIESRHPALAKGDIVAGYDGWQEYAISSGAMLRKLDPAAAPISTAIGVLGMPGMTAYVGLLDIGQPKPGETVVVSAASGAVGSVVGQIARIKGCRAVGVAGSPAKCEYVVKDLGFDVCVNYKDADFPEKLRAACPSGVDVYFENVGGAVLAAVLPLLNVHARIPLCGTISEYNATEKQAGPPLRHFLVKRALIQGFIISDHNDRLAAFMRDGYAWLRDGRLKYREDIVDGLEQAPPAFLKLFDGENFGKLLVRVSPDPTRTTSSGSR